MKNQFVVKGAGLFSSNDKATALLVKIPKGSATEDWILEWKSAEECNQWREYLLRAGAVSKSSESLDATLAHDDNLTISESISVQAEVKDELESKLEQLYIPEPLKDQESDEKTESLEVRESAIESDPLPEPGLLLKPESIEIKAEQKQEPEPEPAEDIEPVQNSELAKDLVLVQNLEPDSVPESHTSPADKLEPVQDLDLVQEPESVVESEPVRELDSVQEPESKAESVQNQEPVQDLDLVQEPESEAEPVVESEPVQDLDSVQEPESEAEPVVELEPVRDLDSVQEPESEAEAEPVVELEPLQDLDSVQEPESEPESVQNQEPESELAPAPAQIQDLMEEPELAISILEPVQPDQELESVSVHKPEPIRELGEPLHEVAIDSFPGQEPEAVSLYINRDIPNSTQQDHHESQSLGDINNTTIEPELSVGGAIKANTSKRNLTLDTYFSSAFAYTETQPLTPINTSISLTSNPSAADDDATTKAKPPPLPTRRPPSVGRRSSSASEHTRDCYLSVSSDSGKLWVPRYAMVNLSTGSLQLSAEKAG